MITKGVGYSGSGGITLSRSPKTGHYKLSASYHRCPDETTFVIGRSCLQFVDNCKPASHSRRYDNFPEMRSWRGNSCQSLFYSVREELPDGYLLEFLSPVAYYKLFSAYWCCEIALVNTR